MVKIKKILLLIFFSFCAQSCGLTYVPFKYEGKKFKGLSLVAPPDSVGISPFVKIKNTGANAISLMPYAFLPENENKLRFSKITDIETKRKQWWGETPAGIISCIKSAKTLGLSVMIKPHLWLKHGQFTGDLNFKNESDFLAFEDSYTQYVFQYAKIAQEHKVEMFCVGTELATWVKKRPEYWRNLCLELRKVFKGSITYAENWDVIADTDLWKHLDFIGVDAYFPLAKGANPSPKDLKGSWQKHNKTLAKLGAKFQKPILFTELGYKANDHALEKPWEVDYTKPYNEDIQKEAYLVFFKEVWQEPWFAGVYFWKWFPSKEKNLESFSPQGRKAEKILIENYTKLN